MEQNTLLWDRKAYTPRRGAYPTLLRIDNGGREIQPLYLSPTRYFKLKVFMIKNHINARNP